MKKLRVELEVPENMASLVCAKETRPGITQILQKELDKVIFEFKLQHLIKEEKRLWET